MLYMEWYRKKSKRNKIGYYDQFKTQIASPVSAVDTDVKKLKKELNDYWKSVVEEVEKKPQSETSSLRKGFLYSGTNYRRMIEPLDIAEYYLSGRREYRTLGRSHHYVMLEKWFKEELIEPVRSERRDFSELLTFDSCFWAEVEEAMIVVNELKTQKGRRDEVLTRKLVWFEDYLWGMIGKREISPEIFLEKSSFMRWWKEYQEIKGRDGFDSSNFTEFMNTGMYESYGLNHSDGGIVKTLDDVEEEHPSRTLFVRNVNSKVDDSELRALFEQYGDIQTLYTTRKNRGLVMISYYDIRASIAARRALQNELLGQRKLSIHFSIPKENPSEKNVSQGTLLVLNLAPSVSIQELENKFGAYGEIKEIRGTSNVRDPKSVEFFDVRSADTAFKALNGSDTFGKRIKLEYYRPAGALPNMQLQWSLELETGGSLSNNNLFDSPSLAGISSVVHSQGETPKKAVLVSNPCPATMDATDTQKLDSTVDLSKINSKEDTWTTLMIKNIPTMYTTEMLLDAIHDGPYPIMLEAAKEMTRETECMLVFSCSDSHDVDETHFIKAILKELREREVSSLTYNLLGRENLDVEMLDRSSVGIIILSNSCAYSSRSMDHLVEIMEHGKATNRVIIPIYFKVCGLAEEFPQLLNYAQPDRVQKWKTALTELAFTKGHEWTKQTQDILAGEVVRDACVRLYLKNSKSLVRILALLNHSHPSDADIVGIWGMPGIGKTSIAREIFGTLAPQYDLCYFLQDFYLTCQKKGLRQMRDDFFSKVFGEVSLSISACDIKPSFMRDWSHSKKILVVLDGVNYARDAEAVIGGFGWFSHGHRIILTSRRKQVLVQCKVKEPYKIQSLCRFESFRLCKQYLNGESEVIFELMRCSSGIPLSLEVLGSSLSKEHINNRKEHLQWLRRNPPTKIQEAFQRSFDGLDENEKNIFLDLACFFRGEDKDHVVQILDACGFFTSLGICELIDESLISLLHNRIEIPIPFQDMGRFIVNEEDEDPCERSRLWDSNDIADVLTKNSGTEAIEGIFMDASDLTCEFSPTVFTEMHRLRLLKLYCSTSWNLCKLNLPQGLDTLPDELRLLHWESYPLKYLPNKFNPENLVEINMPYSKMERLWEGQKNLGQLKKIRLSDSINLTDVMMLSEAMNLEHINLAGCTSLVDVSTSIPLSGKLVSLNMKDCSNLRTLPAMVGLTSLKLLNLTDCSKLQEIRDFAPNLKELYLAGTPITELPLSTENIGQLVTLDLENCRRLQHLPFGIRNSRSIVELKLFGCSSLKSLSKLEALD